MRDQEFYRAAGASFGYKIKVMSNSPANSRTRDTLLEAIEDRKTKIPKEYLQAFEEGLDKYSKWMH